MRYWLAKTEHQMKRGWIKRFDPRFWAVTFPRPMMASVVTTASDALRFDAVFYRADDLAGPLWEAEDRHDHPLLASEPSPDFAGWVLRLRWHSEGPMPITPIQGPTFRIEGTEARGWGRDWCRHLQ